MTVASSETSVVSPDRMVVRVRGRMGLEGATVLCGAALAVLTARDGSAGWQLLRVVTVASSTAAALFGELRLAPKWRGRIAAIVGVLATAVAVGFAPHLVKGGPLLVRAATLALAASGVGLTAGGTVAATRARPLPRRIATDAAMAVITALVIFVVSPAVGRCPRRVGVRGFEPPASTSRTWRANQAALHPVAVGEATRPGPVPNRSVRRAPVPPAGRERSSAASWARRPSDRPGDDRFDIRLGVRAAGRHHLGGAAQAQRVERLDDPPVGTAALGEVDVGDAVEQHQHRDRRRQRPSEASSRSAIVTAIPPIEPICRSKMPRS